MIPDYLQGNYFWKALWPLLLAPAILALLGGYMLTRRRSMMPMFGAYVGTLMAFGLLGIVIGNITGLSRNPAVTAVLPAILTLIGGLLGYVTGAKPLRQQALVAGGIACMSIMLLVGVLWGSRARVLFEVQNQNSVELAVRQEDLKLASALRALANEAKFLGLKKEMEQQLGLQLTTSYASGEKPKSE